MPARATQPLKPYREFCEMRIEHQIGPHSVKANPANDQAQREIEQGDTDPIGLANLGLNRRNYALNLINLIILFLTLFAVVLYTAATYQANKIATTGFEVSARPWISLTATPISPLTFDKQGAHITLHFVLRNRGKSAATGVSIWGFFVFPVNSFGALKTQEDWCAGRRKAVESIKRYAKVGVPLFPEDTPYTQDISFILNESDIQATQEAFSKGSEPKVTFILPQIVGCVIYNFGDAAYDTDFRYQFYGNIDGARAVPIADLGFMASEIGNEAH
jgi:hypothetical protein